MSEPEYIQEAWPYKERFETFLDSWEKGGSKQAVYKEIDSYPISNIAKLHLAAYFGVMQS